MPPAHPGPLRRLLTFSHVFYIQVMTLYVIDFRALSKGLEDEEASILEENERKKREAEERDRQVAEATQALTLAEIEAKKVEEEEQARRAKEEEEEARRLGLTTTTTTTTTTFTSEFALRPKTKKPGKMNSLLTLLLRYPNIT